MPKEDAKGHDRADVAGEAIAQRKSSDGVSAPTRIGEKTLLLSPLPGLIISGFVALVVWGSLEVMPPAFELSERLRDLSGNAPEEQQKEKRDASLAASNNNAALSLGLLASTLSLFLTVTEVKQRCLGSSAIWGGLLAILIAGVFAVGGAVLGGTLAASSALPEDPLARTIFVQGAMMGMAGLGVGAGIGFAVTLPTFQPRLLATCLAGGMLGGLLAGLIYPFTASILLPNARTEVLMPDPGVTRLLWLALAASPIVLTLTGMGKERKSRK